AAFLQGLGYGITDISNVLNSVYVTGAAIGTTILNGLNYGVTEIGGVLKNVFNQTADQAAQLMATISSDVAAIGGILKDVFTQTAQQVGQLLKDKLSATVDAISQFLKSAAGFSLAASGAASLLKAIGFSASDIKNELTSLYNTAINDIGNILSSIGFSSGDISALGGALASFGQSVADCFSSFFSDC
ncbi:MAG TPA: hypothetical protein VHT75_14045, partial [Acidimicrobiales bacterium]|nr:hypothetical protein [Acidimicrobiales bacterium]